MTLDLPEGAHIHILVAPTPIAPAWTPAASPASAPVLAAAPISAPPRPRRLLKSAAVLGLVVVAYLAGAHVHPSQPATYAPARAAFETPARSSPAMPPDVAALRQQLQAPPTVTPPPGAPAPAARPGQDGFGMEN